MVVTLMVFDRLSGVCGGVDASSLGDKIATKGCMISTSCCSWASTCAFA